MSRNEGITSGRIADLVSGTLVGRSNIELAGIAPLGRAGPGDLSFLASGSYLPYFRRTNAGAVLVSCDLQSAIAGTVTYIAVPDVRHALSIALEALYPTPEIVWGVHHTAVIRRGARWSGRVAIGPRAKLGRGVVLGTDCIVEESAVIKHGAVLGDRCHIGPFAYVGPSTELGDRVFLKAGARVGMAGYGFATTENGHVRLPHIGGCFIGNDVEIGTNTTVDRGSIDDTVIGAGTKIDNLVQIAHNVRIGERCLIMAQVGLAGSTRIEDDVLIAGQAGLAGHLTVGKGARLAAQAGVIGDVPAGATVSGYPARSHRDVLRQSAALRRLTGIVSTLEKIVERNVPK